MRLTLDWDSEELKDIHQPAVRERSPYTENQSRIASFIDADEEAGGDKYEIYKSSSHGVGDKTGYHYIEYNESGNLQRIRQMRTAYGDDALRVSLDQKRERIGSPFNSVLYSLKNASPNSYPPYDTPKRAELVRREGFDTPDREQEQTKEDGQINYAELVRRLTTAEYFGTYAALYEQVQNRPSVELNYSAPRKRAGAIANKKRTVQKAEAKALRDYAQAREIGHYGDSPDEAQFDEPPALRSRPHRTTIHEYFEMPKVEEFGTESFGDDDDESKYYPSNIRTGRYRGGDTDAEEDDMIDETTLKQIHDSISDEILSILSPGTTPEDQDEYKGIDLSRWDRMISVERDRPLDEDEFTEFREIWHENQPNMSSDRVMKLHESAGIPDAFSKNIVHFEVIVYDGEDALKQQSDPDVWWLVHGIIDASDEDNRRRPLYNSTIVADTRRFL